MVASQANKLNRLEVSNDSPHDGVTVYFVESKVTSTGVFGGNHGGSPNCTLTVTGDLLPDKYEADNTRETHKAIYEGQPQVHNFHQASDQDWTAFALLPGFTSEVELQGNAAAASRLELYRHVNYPNGPIELVSTHANTAGSLIVEHSTSTATTEPYIVYYVKAAPNAGNVAAIKSNYNLTVRISGQ